ncbi:Lanosterol 14-alpha-demethylase [Puccinia graminis f. sp. tritici]|uniref:Lanosterol 14-alpha-demethylase n=1 Tax=Puccinia graminis f. sp. tritici TaxID=56615 RepID=A0A5B0MXB0_PUCGR|nr:Lanosterol 14-alpha-demethylase [Puccinia graminis f. sp. tritici]
MSSLIDPLIEFIGSFSTFNQILIYFLLSITSIISINIFNQLAIPKDPTTPPVVFHLFPFIGSAVSYGIDPYAFLESCRKKYGNVFTFVLLNKKVTVALGLEGNALILNGKLSQVNAEEAYTALTTPVFGTDVVYDVPNAILMQQKKFIKSGLTTENFRKYVTLIADETISYLEDHVFEKPKTQQAVKDCFKVASEITICTASATLQGPEVREGLNKSFANLYHDLDGGFTPLHFAFPNLPLPSYRRRDRAQVAMRNFYMNIIQKRREDNREGQLGDMIDSLQGQTYKDGRPLTDKEIAHIMIALLMAGQHTSAATGSWLLLHLASRPDIVAELRQEQIEVFGKPGQTDDKELDPLDLERVQSPLMLACIKEVLRLHPPIHSIMRKVKSPITVPRTLASHNEDTPYIIPSSNFVLAAPGASQIDPAIWSSPDEFEPSRWLKLTSPFKAGGGETQEEMVDYGFGMISSGANSPFLPFGAGRHRCIGEQFAYLQLSTLGATVIRNCELELVSNQFPKPDYTTMLVCPIKPRDVKFTRRNTHS